MRQPLHQPDSKSTALQPASHSNVNRQVEAPQRVPTKSMFGGLSSELLSSVQGEGRKRLAPIPQHLEAALANVQTALNIRPASSRFRGLSHEFVQSATPLIETTIAQWNSPAEQEADQVAKQVMNHPDLAQTKSCSAVPNGMAVSPSFERSLEQSRSSGQLLSEPMRQQMEQSFGRDFSQVRIHTDAQSDRLNQSIAADAFTTGQDIFFRQGAYAPEDRQGQKLIAHELWHVVQQDHHASQSTPIIQCQLNQAQLLTMLSNKQGEARREAVKKLIAELETQGLQANAPNAARHSPDIAAKLEEFKTELSSLANAPKYDAAWKDEFLANLSGYINLYNSNEQSLQQAEQTNLPRYKLESQVKIGTEFTFTNDALATLAVGQASTALTTAESLIEQWKSKVDSKYNDKSVQKVPPSQGSNLKPKSHKAVQFIYTLQDNSTWWWALDLDDGCLETQTQPMTYTQAAGEIQAIIDRDIFGLAQTLRLRTDPEIGGGHITIDGATAFQNDARILRNFLVLYHSDPQKWSAYDTDASNAPMMHELPKATRQKFKEIVDEVETKITNPKPIGKTQQLEPPMSEADLVKKLRDMYKTTEAWAEKWDEPISKLKDLTSKEKDTLGNPTDPLFNAAQNVSLNRTHYQATNIENMDKGDQKRIEMRRFAAQQSGDDLLQQLKELLDLLFESGKTGIRPLPASFVNTGRK